MTAINVYKIALSKKLDLSEFLDTQYENLASRSISIANVFDGNGEGDALLFATTLFYSSKTDGKELSWNWVLDAYNIPKEKIETSPKCVIWIESQTDVYAVTFGHSYFKVDQYSDKEWAFDFARRLKYKNIRTTALTNPNSKRNKSIHTYVDYDNLEIASGEALTKLKACIELDSGFSLFSNIIEIGNSIRFQCKSISLEKIIQIIAYVNQLIESISDEKDMVKIPCFKQIIDPVEIQCLFEKLKISIKNDIAVVDFSEYQIWGTQIVFQDNNEYSFHHKRKIQNTDILDSSALMDFIKKNNFNVYDDFLHVRIIVVQDGVEIFSSTVDKLIYYTDEDNQVLLSDGKWFQFNKDYLEYLADSLTEIPVSYDKEFNYSRKKHDEFVDAFYKDNKASPNYRKRQRNRRLSDTAIKRENGL